LLQGNTAAYDYMLDTPQG